MKIGIIGTVNRDTIKLPDGTIKEGWGGILYNIAALSKFTNRKIEIYPAANVGSDCFTTVINIVKYLSGVRVDYLKEVSEKNNHCFLTYHDYENKSEILKGRVRPLKYDDVKPLLNCDIILVNYISGRDIYLRSLQKLRRHYSGRIYIDIHSLTLGKKKGGHRYLRYPPNWSSVVEAGDYIQMNQLELSILACQNPNNKNMGTIDSNIKILIETLRKKRIDTKGNNFIVTDGASGCHIYFWRESEWKFLQIPPKRVSGNKDTTGCGDCFSAGFIAGLIEDHDLRICAGEANLAALSRIEGNIQPQKMRKT
jgi:sugar/nucleoside kinase (ribokinase family)